MVYRLALGTGFRASELRSLTPASFDLDADPPTVSGGGGLLQAAPAGPAAHPARLGGTAAALAGGTAGGVPVFGKLPGGTARMLRTDLAAARRRGLTKPQTDAGTRSPGASPTSCGTRTRPVKWRTSTRRGTRTFRRIVAGGKASVKTCPGAGPAFHARLDHRPILPRPATRPDGGPGRPARPATPPETDHDSPQATADGRDIPDGPETFCGGRCGGSRDGRSVQNAGESWRTERGLHERETAERRSASLDAGGLWRQKSRIRRDAAEGGQPEAPVGVEPTVADLQSAALATWRRRQITLGNLENLCPSGQ